jgi:lipopolysaccharide transport system permease protein
MILRLAGRRIEGRYRGSVLGLGWVLVEPLALLAIYTFVFSLVFRARWGSLPAEHGNFALFLFSGLTIYSVFSETVNESPNAVLASEAYVKQFVFPSEVLAWVAVVAALFKFAISSALLVACYRLTVGNLPITSLFLPLIVLPVVFLTLGVTWFLSALGVYFRDLGQAVGLFTTALLFVSPIFYPASTIPEPYRGLYFLNPFAGILEMSKRSLFDGQIPDLPQVMLLLIVGWGAAWLGHAWFVRVKAGFADVL